MTHPFEEAGFGTAPFTFIERKKRPGSKCAYCGKAISYVYFCESADKRSLQNVLPLYGAFGGIYAFSNVQTNSTGTSSGTGGSPWASFMQGVVNGNVRSEEHTSELQSLRH